MRRAAGALWLLGLAIGAVGGAVHGAVAEEQDRRSQVILEEWCRTHQSEGSLTLFANGTLRWRRGAGPNSGMRLAELAPSELDAFIRRLAAEDLSEIENLRPGIDGRWLEECRLDLDLPGLEPRLFRYTRLDALPLELAHVLGIVAELQELAAERSAAASLPEGYEPMPGDLLVRFDGALFEVFGLTSDGHGVELQGIDQPLVVYVPLEDLGREFSRRSVDAQAAEDLERERP